MKKIFSALLIMFLFCAPVLSEEHKKQGQLELREIQTHFYDTADLKKVQAAVFSALQDDGFVITMYEDKLGYLTAARDFKDRRTDKVKVASYSALLALQMTSAIFTYGATAAYAADPAMRLSNELHDKHIMLAACVLVEPFGKQTKVRVNFIEKVRVYADGYSYIRPAIRSVRRIDNPTMYQNFFSEIDKSLFIEDQKL